MLKNKIIMTINKHFTVLLFGLICLLQPGKAQTSDDESKPEYLYKEFSDAEVLFKYGKRESMMLNYNILAQKMILENKGKLLEFTNPSNVDTIYLHESKFVPVGAAFYQIISNAPISFFVQHKGRLILPGKPAAYGGTSQVSSTDVVATMYGSNGSYALDLPEGYKVTDNSVYWISKKDKFYSFMNERQFLKIFPEKSKELKQYIEDKKIKIKDLSGLIDLAAYCNKIYKE